MFLFYFNGDIGDWCLFEGVGGDRVNDDIGDWCLFEGVVRFSR